MRSLLEKEDSCQYFMGNGWCSENIRKCLERPKGLVHGVTCGAGMPYKLAEIASKFNISIIQ